MTTGPSLGVAGPSTSVSDVPDSRTATRSGDGLRNHARQSAVDGSGAGTAMLIRVTRPPIDPALYPSLSAYLNVPNVNSTVSQFWSTCRSPPRVSLRNVSSGSHLALTT